jgi:hypothetical protein
MKMKTKDTSFEPMPFLALAALLLATTACPSSTSSGDSDETAASDDDGSDYLCDPVGDNPTVGELLNAPLADDVEVIQKEPQHPGDPGPENLPE